MNQLMIELQVPHDMICPLSYEVMMHPVTHRRFGYTCEEAAIQLWLESGETRCPLTGHRLDRSDFTANRALQERIMDWRLALQIAAAEERERQLVVAGKQGVGKDEPGTSALALPSTSGQRTESALVI